MAPPGGAETKLNAYAQLQTTYLSLSDDTRQLFYITKKITSDLKQLNLWSNLLWQTVSNALDLE